MGMLRVVPVESLRITENGRGLFKDTLCVGYAYAALGSTQPGIAPKSSATLKLSLVRDSNFSSDGLP
jgi:hypothetical protein